MRHEPIRAKDIRHHVTSIQSVSNWECAEWFWLRCLPPAEPTRILRQPEYKVVERNRVAVFECKVKHDPTLVPTMIWLKDNAELPADERYTHHTHTHTHVCPYTHKHACVSTQTHTHGCISLCSSVFYYNILLLLLYNYIQYYLTILA